MVQLDTPGKRAERCRRQVEHGLRRIDADEAPLRVRLCERLQLHAAAGADDQHVRRFGRVLCDEQRGHGLQVVQAGDDAGGFSA
jgi:hypothetical protein